MNGPNNILLVRLKSLGDIIFTVPAVNLVRDNFPDANITFMVSKEYSPLIAGFREVNEVIPVDRELYRRKNLGAIVGETLALLNCLRRGNFSLVADFQGYGETALLTYLTRAVRRFGMVNRPARRWAYTHPVRLRREQHPIEWNISMLRECGLKVGQIRNEFLLPSANLDEAHSYVASLGIDPSLPTLFVQPFTSTPLKTWPLENYITLARHWRASGVQVVFGGGPNDCVALKSALDSGFPVSAGVSLLTTAGLMKLSALVLGGDTGMLHLAVAMNQRVVMLMGSSKARTHPFQHPDWAIAPLENQYVASLTPNQVIKACEDAFSSSTTGRVTNAKLPTEVKPVSQPDPLLMLQPACSKPHK